MIRRASRSSRNCGSYLFMQCFPKNVILVLFGECIYKTIKSKCYPQGYGLLIFYKKGHFKFNFSYFDKNPPPFPTEEKWKKNSQNSKMLSNISKKCFYTNFKSASDDVISFEKLAWRHFVWRAFHIYFIWQIARLWWGLSAS